MTSAVLVLLALLVAAGPGSLTPPDPQRDISASVSRLAADRAARTGPASAPTPATDSPAGAERGHDCKGGKSERRLPFPTVSLTQHQPDVAAPDVPYAVDPALSSRGARPAPSRPGTSSVDLHRLQVLRT